MAVYLILLHHYPVERGSYVYNLKDVADFSLLVTGTFMIFNFNLWYFIKLYEISSTGSRDRLPRLPSELQKEVSTGNQGQCRPTLALTSLSDHVHRFWDIYTTRCSEFSLLYCEVRTLYGMFLYFEGFTSSPQSIFSAVLLTNQWHILLLYFRFI